MSEGGCPLGTKNAGKQNMRFQQIRPFSLWTKMFFFALWYPAMAFISDLAGLKPLPESAPLLTALLLFTCAFFTFAAAVFFLRLMRYCIDRWHFSVGIQGAAFLFLILDVALPLSFIKIPGLQTSEVADFVARTFFMGAIIKWSVYWYLYKYIVEDEKE